MLAALVLNDLGGKSEGKAWLIAKQTHNEYTQRFRVKPSSFSYSPIKICRGFISVCAA